MRIVFLPFFIGSGLFIFMMNVVWSQTPKSQFTPAEKKVLKMAYSLVADSAYRPALNELLKGYKVNPNNLPINYLTGKCYFEIGQKEKARPYLKKVIGCEPLNVHFKKEEIADIYWLYGGTLHHLLEIDSARQYYRKHADFFKPGTFERKKADLALKWCDNAEKLIKKPLKVKVENCGPNVNTRFPEYCPVISADGSTLFFTSRRTENLGTEKQDDLPLEDIYFCKRMPDGSYSKSANLGPPVNTVFHDATVNVSVDGQTALIYREGDLYFSKLKGNKWSEPQMFPAPITEDAREASATLSPDNRILYFDRDDPYYEFDKDLFVTLFNKYTNKWSLPKPLIGINTKEYDEGAPLLHPDGKTLYYSSNGPESMGGYDLFKTTLLPGNKWSKPENLGYPINTPGDDSWMVFTADGKHAYYSAEQEGGYGDHDIYRITFEEPAAPPQLTLLKGKVTDEENGQPVEATLYVIDNDRNDTLAVFNSNSETGEYLISLPNGKNYGISVQTKGFIFRSENVFIPADSAYFREKDLDFKLRKPEFSVGKKFLLKNIFYDFDKATLRNSSISELERLRQILNDYPRMEIKILSHTDYMGSDEYNLKLSHERAKSVVDYLTRKGIASTRLSYEGLGESQPVDTNETDEGRQNNRRTEFEVMKM